jgi:hypothetical protein
MLVPHCEYTARDGAPGSDWMWPVSRTQNVVLFPTFCAWPTLRPLATHAS